MMTLSVLPGGSLHNLESRRACLFQTVSWFFESCADSIRLAMTSCFKLREAPWEEIARLEEEDRKLREEYREKYSEDWVIEYAKLVTGESAFSSDARLVNTMVYGGEACRRETLARMDEGRARALDGMYEGRCRKLYGVNYDNLIGHAPESPAVGELLIADAIVGGRWLELPDALRKECCARLFDWHPEIDRTRWSSMPAECVFRPPSSPEAVRAREAYSVARRYPYHEPLQAEFLLWGAVRGGDPGDLPEDLVGEYRRRVAIVGTGEPDPKAWSRL